MDDTTQVLEHEPNNVKCLIRRAQALEAMERYRLALQDVRQVLQMPVAEIGQQTFQVCVCRPCTPHEAGLISVCHW